MEGGGAARQGERVLNARDLGELAFEGVDVRAERRDPVRVDRIPEQVELATGDMWGRQVDPRHSGTSVTA